MSHTRHVLLAIQTHPATMSPILLEYLLRGESIGRMKEKGLDTSPHRGLLQDAANWKGSGFYPSLRLTPLGESQLATGARPGCAEAAPDVSYRAYYRWRNGINTRLATLPVGAR